MSDQEFPLISISSGRDSAASKAAALDNWGLFKEAVMGLKSGEVLEVASRLDGCLNRVNGYVFGPYADKAQQVPELLMNFAQAVGNAERRSVGIDRERVLEVSASALNSTFFALAAFSDKMSARIEFQPEVTSMPRDLRDIEDLALNDAIDGSARGFHWGCFRLRHAFANPGNSALDTERALDLFSALSAVPDLILDQFGEAAVPDVIQMERNLNIIRNMPVYS
jgi:hypothetical protein